MRRTLLICLLSHQTNADLPIKCPKSLIEPGSSWTFHVSEQDEKVSLYKSKQVCSHKLPNHVQIVDDSFKFSFD